MKISNKIQWLKRVLLIKAILTILVWGLPALIGPSTFLALFDLEMPEDPTFLRLFGAVVTAFGVAYWYAYRDPLRNAAIVRAGVVDNGLVTLAIIVLGFTTGVSSWFIWVSALLTAIFFVAFLVLMPKDGEESPATT